MTIIKNVDIETTMDIEIDLDEIWDSLSFDECKTLFEYIVESFGDQKFFQDSMKESINE